MKSEPFYDAIYRWKDYKRESARLCESDRAAQALA
jgi:hypothetical protein